MSRLPFMQFYPADWLQDTRCLSKEVRGVWIDLLCAMWIARKRGRLEWTKKQFEAFVGAETDPQMATDIWNELLHSGVGNFKIKEEIMFIESRRIIREELKRNQACERQSRKRHADVTPKSRCILQKSEVRSHISEEDKKPPAAVFVLPDWIPEKSWRDFEEHRRKMRTPLSTRAKELAVKQLELLRKEGHEPAAVLDNCIARGWRGIFAPKENGNKPPAPKPRAKIERPPELTDEQIEKNKAFLKDLLGKIGAKE